MVKKSSKPSRSFSGREKRKATRRPLVDSFSFFIVLPKRGMHRLPVYDVSESGLGFAWDIEEEDMSHGSPISEGEDVELHFYLNQSLYLPLRLRVVRLTQRKGIRCIGAEFIERSSKGYKAMASVIKMLDQVIDGAYISRS